MVETGGDRFLALAACVSPSQSSLALLVPPHAGGAGAGACGGGDAVAGSRKYPQYTRSSSLLFSEQSVIFLPRRSRCGRMRRW